MNKVQAAPHLEKNANHKSRNITQSQYPLAIPTFKFKAFIYGRMMIHANCPSKNLMHFVYKDIKEK